MIRALYRAADGTLHSTLPPERFAAALEDDGGLLWVDFQGEPNANSEPILRDTFRFHPLAIDDALQETHVPRVDDWGAYLYLVLHAVVFGSDDGPDLQTLEWDVFLGTNYIVTHHDYPIPAIDHVWARCQHDERMLTNGPDHVLYELSDHLVTRYIPVIESLDDAIDEIEASIFDHPTAQALEDLFSIKQAVIHVRRIMAPQREVFNRLARDEYAAIDRRKRVYFRDIYDHLVRLHDTVDGMRDLVSSAVDTYLSVANNRLGDVMKTLTIITTLFMPMTFLAGFFGMNFFAAPGPTHAWTGTPALLTTLGLMLVVPVTMYLWLRRRGWM